MTAILAKFDYSYTHGGKTVSFKIGDRFSLINKANNDWWHVKRCSVSGGFEELYVPVLYVEEVIEQATSTQSLDRRVEKRKTSSEKTQIPEDTPHEIVYENLKPAPKAPQTKERTPQPTKPEKSITLPRTLSGSTFGTAISPQEFPDNPASPPLMSPVRNTPSPPCVAPKPVTRAGSSDKLVNNVMSPTGPPPVKIRTHSSTKKRHSSGTLEEPGETSTFAKSLPNGQNLFPIGNTRPISRTVSAEVKLFVVIIN